MTGEVILSPVFEVRIGPRVFKFQASIIGQLVARAGSPRPGQEFTLRDVPEDFAVDVVYVRHPEAPADRVTYGEIARAWGDLANEGVLMAVPNLLNVGAARRVIDQACQHLGSRA